jgi:putative effector of murein hydrolase
LMLSLFTRIFSWNKMNIFYMLPIKYESTQHYALFLPFLLNMMVIFYTTPLTHLSYRNYQYCRNMIPAATCGASSSLTSTWTGQLSPLNSSDYFCGVT